MLCDKAALSAEVKHRMMTRDITLRVPSADGILRFTFVSATHALREAVRRHGLLTTAAQPPRVVRALGETLCLANTLAAGMEGEERAEAVFTTDELSVRAMALAVGECVACTDGRTNAQAAAEGRFPFMLDVSQTRYGATQPFRSTTFASLDELLPAADETPAEESEEVGPPFAWREAARASGVDEAQWRRFFSHNLTPHAYTFFRKSEGVSPALWLQADVQGDRCAQLQGPPPAGSADAAGYASGVEAALREDVRSAFGIVAVPLAGGAALDRRVWRVQNALAAAAAAESEGPLAPLVLRAATAFTACQDTLSLLSGDYEGAFAVAAGARQYREDPAAVAAVVEPIRKQLGIEGFRAALDTAGAARTGLDFFCRCSKRGVMQSLAGAPAAVMAQVRESPDVTCTLCRTTHYLTPEEIDSIEKASANRGS